MSQVTSAFTNPAVGKSIPLLYVEENNVKRRKSMSQVTSAFTNPAVGKSIPLLYVEENNVKRRKSMSQVIRAFSLIELICTILVLNILMVLVTGAVQASKRTLCIDNERKLGQVLTQYANDNDNYLPYPIGNDYRPPFSWVITLHRQGYISGTNKDLYFYNRYKSKSLSKLYAPLSCPAAGPNSEENIQRGWWCSKSASSGDYGINCYFSTSDSSGRQGNFGGRIRLTECRMPAQSILLADANAKQIYLPYGDVSTVERHDDTANLLMGDGAVRTAGELTEEQIRYGFQTATN